MIHYFEFFEWINCQTFYQCVGLCLDNDEDPPVEARDGPYPLFPEGADIVFVGSVLVCGGGAVGIVCPINDEFGTIGCGIVDDGIPGVALAAAWDVVGTLPIPFVNVLLIAIVMNKRKDKTYLAIKYFACYLIHHVWEIACNIVLHYLDVFYLACVVFFH